MGVSRQGDEVGLFGPDSVTWQLHADPVMWVAGVRALYLQALHPSAVRGVVQNSDIRKDSWGRLIRTADFVGTTTYGTRAEAEQAGARVRRIHAMLRATDPETGETYRIDEPELLCWVHCAEVGSYLSVARQAGFPMTDDLADRYLDEQRRSAEMVGLPGASVPGSLAELDRYFTDIQPSLANSAEAQDVYEFLRRPPVPILLVLGREVLWRQVAELAYAALPRWAKELYGHRGLPGYVAGPGLKALRAAAGAATPVIRALYPSPHIKSAMDRLGPDVKPSPARLPIGAGALGTGTSETKPLRTGAAETKPLGTGAAETKPPDVGTAGAGSLGVAAFEVRPAGAAPADPAASMAGPLAARPPRGAEVSPPNK
ncbi:oxygenase MpaB family protein [Streptomyces sp. SID3343]|uniref:oxygenase MpaB family protein n=1 Tax=Streptomyces sp. SID3343 TaxID=2690260 RepID=UPI0031F7ADF4